MNNVLLVLLILICALGNFGLAADAPATKSAIKPVPVKKVNPKDGAELVLIPAGKFLMGTSYQQFTEWLKTQPKRNSDLYRIGIKDELPQHLVYLDAYYIYKNDVTVAQYRKFCIATGRKMPPKIYKDGESLEKWMHFCDITGRKKPNKSEWGWIETHPMENVSWDDAMAYATWANAALPTEEEWEKAARGTDARIYPWGNKWDGMKCCNSVGKNKSLKTSPVGSFPAGASPFGVLDMEGNVSQWCADWYDEGFYINSPLKNPKGHINGKKINARWLLARRRYLGISHNIAF